MIYYQAFINLINILRVITILQIKPNKYFNLCKKSVKIIKAPIWSELFY